MGRTFLLALGLGTGYVLGTRAGREQYDKIAGAANRVWESPKVAKARTDVEAYAKQQGPIIAERAEAVAKATPGAIADGARKTADTAKDIAERTTIIAKDVAGRTSVVAKDVAGRTTILAKDVAEKVVDTANDVKAKVVPSSKKTSTETPTPGDSDPVATTTF
jgi:hypothetical protein